ncbi:MAG: hydrogenase iron-sulfur subunit [Candidatus Bathyarchaeota archaeon]
MIIAKAKAVQTLTKEAKRPNVIVMYCQWSNFFESTVDFENVISPNVDGNITYIALPCLGRLDMSHLIHVLYVGFDGVLAVGCKKDSCKMDKIDGNDVAEARIMNAKAMLKNINLDKNVSIDFVSPEYLTEFSNYITSFIDQLKKNSQT